MRAKPGEHVDLTAVPAPNAAAAAHYYPAIYWYSLLRVPAENELKGDSPLNDPGLQSKQANFLRQMKNIGCIGCHQLGQEATRTIPAQFGVFKTGEEAWIPIEEGLPQRAFQEVRADILAQAARLPPRLSSHFVLNLLSFDSPGKFVRRRL